MIFSLAALISLVAANTNEDTTTSTTFQRTFATLYVRVTKSQPYNATTTASSNATVGNSTIPENSTLPTSSASASASLQSSHVANSSSSSIFANGAAGLQMQYAAGVAAGVAALLS